MGDFVHDGLTSGGIKFLEAAHERSLIPEEFRLFGAGDQNGDGHRESEVNAVVQRECHRKKCPLMPPPVDWPIWIFLIDKEKNPEFKSPAALEDTEGTEKNTNERLCELRVL